MEKRESQNKETSEKTTEKKKIKLEWDEETINTLIDKLNEDKETYLLTLTNYTCLIETNQYDFYFAKYMQRPVVFSIVKEIKRHIDSSLNSIPCIDRNKMSYYSVSIKTKPFYSDTAYNIDINAAYPACLLLNNLIDDKLYKRMMSLTKNERLVSIGMLASKKRIFSIINGQVKDYIIDESEYSKFFFHCVNEIKNVIWKCEVTAGLNFIFSWVDGLYVTSMQSAKHCKKLLSDSGYRSTISKITDFQYTPKEESVNITFLKDSENKLFNIPIQKNSLAQILKFIHHEAIQD